jgi:hypothetical protein
LSDELNFRSLKLRSVELEAVLPGVRNRWFTGIARAHRGTRELGLLKLQMKSCSAQQ